MEKTPSVLYFVVSRVMLVVFMRYENQDFLTDQNAE